MVVFDHISITAWDTQDPMIGWCFCVYGPRHEDPLRGCGTLELPSLACAFLFACHPSPIVPQVFWRRMGAFVWIRSSVSQSLPDMGIRDVCLRMGGENQRQMRQLTAWLSWFVLLDHQFGNVEGARLAMHLKKSGLMGSKAATEHPILNGRAGTRSKATSA